MSYFYRLKGREAVREIGGVLGWADAATERYRSIATKGIDPWRVGDDEPLPGVHVSTVFLGLDHRLRLGGDRGEPLLFETMIFGGDCDGYQDRCSTWEQAEAMHRAAIAHCLVQGALTEGHADE